MGNFQFNIGLRLDHYDGLVTKTEPEPRAGIAYNIKKTGTVLRVAYARTLETPFNENLLLSNATGVGGLAQNVFGSNAVAIQPGFRNQFNTGFQQAVGKFLLIDADYFWKYTHNSYDFSTLLEYHDHIPDRLAQLEAGWRHRPGEHHESSRLPGLLDIRPHARTILSTGDRRSHSPRRASGRRRVPDRSRSGVSIDYDGSLSAPQERGVDRFDVPLRQRPGGQRHSRCRCRACAADSQSAGNDRPRLQWSVRHRRQLRFRTALTTNGTQGMVTSKL